MNMPAALDFMIAPAMKTALTSEQINNNTYNIDDRSQDLPCDKQYQSKRDDG